MGIKDWVLSLVGRGGRQEIKLDEYCGRLQSELYVKNLAVQSAINLIANSLSLSEFETYEKGKKIKKDNYYLFNVEPNINKSASKFWRDVVRNLVFDNECLVIQVDGQLFVADGFQMKDFAFKENIYHDIQVANYPMSGTFKESQVFHFELHNEKIRTIIDGIYEQFGELIEYSKKTYKRSNAKRGILTIPTNYPQTEAAQEQLDNLTKNTFKRFYEAEGGAVLPLTNGLEYEDLSNATYKNGSDSRDIRLLIDDVFDFVAIAFQIPVQLLKMKSTDSGAANDLFVSGCLEPIAELLEDEINRKYFKKKEYLERDFLKINTDRVRYMSLKEKANAADVLLRSGTHNIDENRELFEKEPLGTEQSQEYYVTKNYERAGERKEGDPESSTVE